MFFLKIKRDKLKALQPLLAARETARNKMRELKGIYYLLFIIVDFIIFIYYHNY